MFAGTSSGAILTSIVLWGQLYVVDASSAAPVYFPSVNVNGDWYLDGGVVAAKNILGAPTG